MNKYKLLKGLKGNGKSWIPADIRKIALNPTYVGLRTMNIFGEDITSKYERLSIIDKDTWKKACSIVTILSPKRPIRIMYLNKCYFHCKAY